MLKATYGEWLPHWTGLDGGVCVCKRVLENTQSQVWTYGYRDLSLLIYKMDWIHPSNNPSLSTSGHTCPGNIYRELVS